MSKHITESLVFQTGRGLLARVLGGGIVTTLLNKMETSGE